MAREFGPAGGGVVVPPVEVDPEPDVVPVLPPALPPVVLVEPLPDGVLVVPPLEPELPVVEGLPAVVGVDEVFPLGVPVVPLVCVSVWPVVSVEPVVVPTVLSFGVPAVLCATADVAGLLAL